MIGKHDTKELFAIQCIMQHIFVARLAGFCTPNLYDRFSVQSTGLGNVPEERK